MISQAVSQVPLSDEFLARLSERPDLQRQLGFLPGGGSGSNGGMEARIARLEAHAEHAQADLNTLKGDSAAVRERLARLEERVAHLPSKGFIVAVATAGISLLSAVIGAAVAYQDLLAGLTKGG